MRFTTLLALTIIASSFKDAYSQQQTPCSPENRARYLNQCLAAIHFKALDTANSPYGPSYFKRCPPEERDSINCFETPRVVEPQSLAQLTFRVDNPDLSQLDRFLTIEYTSPPGSYSRCDHTYNYPNTKYFFIDPLSNTTYPSWDLRHAPRTRWDYNEGEIFTLIMVDPNWITKGVVANIQGNDFSTSLIMYDYDGPRNYQNSPRPSTWILYKQTRQVFIERIPSSGFNVTDFAERNHLQGPIAFSWVNALYDPYAVGLFPWGQNCASLVQDALKVHLPGISFLPGPDEIDLSVYLQVHFNTAPTTYTCGEYNVTRPSGDLQLDSIDPESNVLDAADLRLDSLRTLTFIRNKMNPSPKDFDGKLHTMMLITVGGILNGMGINIEGGNFSIRGLDISSGSVQFAYQPPVTTEAEGDLGYMFMLFEQAARLPTTTDPAPYLSGNREFTNFDRFLSDHHLRLLGVARLQVTYDEYSRCIQSNDGAIVDDTAGCRD